MLEQQQYLLIRADIQPGGISYNQEGFSNWFCLELITEGLETAGVISGVNASEVTPVDICRFNILNKHYVQILR